MQLGLQGVHRFLYYLQHPVVVLHRGLQERQDDIKSGTDVLDSALVYFIRSCLKQHHEIEVPEVGSGVIGDFHDNFVHLFAFGEEELLDLVIVLVGFSEVE